MADNNNNDEFSPSTYIGSVPKLAKFHGFIWRYATKMRANEATDEQVTAVAQLICREDAGDLYNAALDMVPELRGEQYYTTPLGDGNQLLQFVAKVGELRRAETDTTTSASPSTADEDHSMSYTRPDVPGGFWRTEVVSLLTMLRPLEEYTGEEKLAIEDVVQILEWMHADRTTRPPLSSLDARRVRDNSDRR